MKKTVSGTKSKGFFAEGVTEAMQARRSKKSGDRESNISIKELRGELRKFTEEMREREESKQLRVLQQKAIEEKMAGTESSGVIKRGIGYTKGLQRAWELEQEYKEAKTGVKGRAGNIAKALGLVKDDETADMISMMFGKKIPKDQLQKQREKFGIKSEEEKKAEAEKAKAEKASKREESAKKRAERDQKINDIFDSVGKIYDMVNNIRLSVEGVANKLKAGQSKEIVAKDGKYFDPTGKRVRKGDIEKKAGLTYSKKTKQYRDKKSGEFVGQEEAERRMNLSPSAKKMAATAGAAKLASAAVAPDATALASKTLTDPTPTNTDDVKTGQDTIINKLNKQEKRSKGMFQFFDNPIGYLTNAFYGFIGTLVGGQIGAGVGLFQILKDYAWPKIKEMVSNAWTSFKKYLSDIHIRIPEIKFPEFTVFGYKIGGFTIIPKTDIQPFSFLEPKPIEAASETTPEATPAAATPAAATPAGPPMGAGRQAAADVAAGTSEPGAAGAAQPAVAQAPAQPTATPAASNMPRGAAPSKSKGLLAPSPDVADAIKRASDAVGVDNSIMLAMAKQESGFNPNAKAGTSSASGLFQFIKGTWSDMVKKYAGKFPVLNKGPFDMDASAHAGALFIKENSAVLQKNKIPVTGTSIYAAHFLGPGGAVKLFNSNPSAPADSILGKAVAAANKFIFYTKDGVARTIGEVQEVLYNKVGKFADQYKSFLGKGGSFGGGGASGSYAAPAAAPSAQTPMATAATAPTPTATPAQPAPSTGQTLARTTTDMSAAKEAAAAPEAAAPTIVPVSLPMARQKMIPPNNSSKANPRMAEDAFVRAISKDFVHPSTFSSVVIS